MFCWNTPVCCNFCWSIFIYTSQKNWKKLQIDQDVYHPNSHMDCNCLTDRWWFGSFQLSGPGAPCFVLRLEENWSVRTGSVCFLARLALILLLCWYFQVVCVCFLLSGRVSSLELTCETLILLSTNLTGSFLCGSRVSDENWTGSEPSCFRLTANCCFLCVSQRGCWCCSTRRSPSATPQVGNTKPQKGNGTHRLSTAP